MTLEKPEQFVRFVSKPGMWYDDGTEVGVIKVQEGESTQLVCGIGEWVNVSEGMGYLKFSALRPSKHSCKRVQVALDVPINLLVERGEDE